MKTAAIIALLKEGKKPMVKLTDVLWDDSWGEKGMLARITSFMDDHDLGMQVMFDFNEHKEHNLGLQSHGYYIYKDGRDTGTTGTIFESGGDMDPNNIVEEVHFEADGDVPVELADGSPILAEYLKSGSTLSYVEWLEKQLDELVPDAMKPWGEKW